MSNEESIIDIANRGSKPSMETVGIPPRGNPTSTYPAAVEVAPKINAPSDRTDMDALTSLLSKVQGKKGYVPVSLPSNGYAYNGIKDIEMKPFSFQDELDLKDIKGSVAEVVSEVIGRCIQGLDYKYLTIPDRDFLLFKLRELTWGNIYPMESTCTGKNCGKINNLQIDLATLPVKLATSILNTSTMVLPDSEVTMVARHPSVKDEVNIGTTAMTYENMYRFIVSLNGITDSKIIAAFIRETTLKDVDTAYNTIYTSNYGFEKVVLYQCNSCKQDNQVILGLSKDFFTPN